MTDNQQIAQTIIQQLGGQGKLKAMIGAYHIFAVDDGLSFKFKGSPKVNYAKITLNSWDLYDIKFLKIHDDNLLNEEIYDDVSCDSLIEVFESHTGLYLSL